MAAKQHRLGVSQKQLATHHIDTTGVEKSKVGSEEEEKRYEGNRTSAQLGDSFSALVVRYQVTRSPERFPGRKMCLW